MIVSEKSNAGRPAKVWAVDSEFIKEGKRDRPEDVHSVQFSDGTPENTFVFENSKDLKQFFYKRHSINVVYGFNALCDIGSIEEMVGSRYVDYAHDDIAKRVNYGKRGAQIIGNVHYGNFKCKIYDAKPMLKGFGFDNLEQCGTYLGLPKLKKPDYLGIRRPTEQEHNYFIEYSARDAIVTSKIVQWLMSLGVDPARLATAGTLAAKVFDLPKRLKRNGRYYELFSPLEQSIRNACFAGRNEAFVTGLTPNVTYHDVKSLYPCSVITTKALTITGAKECYADEVVIGDEVNYGWLQGTFESSNDVWGIPYRLVYDNNHYRNHYVTGKVTGLFHSLDLAAAKVKVHEITRAYKPTFGNDNTIHAKYAKILLDRIDNKDENEDQKRYAKAVLNALTGKIGASHPITETSNFFAYSTILAHSHCIMSKLFEMYRQYLLGTDTDSLFLTADFTGHKFDVTDGEYTIRSKLYMLLTEEQQERLARQQEIFSTKPVYARTAWLYFAEDFFKLFDGTKTSIDTRRDIKHTFATRIKEALEMAKGRWRTKLENIDLTSLAVLKADTKRVRDSYDSYKLIQERRSMPSRAWAYDELVNTSSFGADMSESDENA